MLLADSETLPTTKDNPSLTRPLACYVCSIDERTAEPLLLNC